MLHKQLGVHYKCVCYFEELFCCLKLTLSEEEVAVVGDWGDASP